MKVQLSTVRKHWYPGAPAYEDTVMQKITIPATQQGEDDRVVYKDISGANNPSGFFVREESVPKEVLDALEKETSVVTEMMDIGCTF